MILRQKPYNYKQCLPQHMHTHNVNAHTKYIHMDNTSTSTALLHKVYSMLEPLLLKSSTGDNIDECFQALCSFYKDDFQPDDLCSQLTTFATNLRSTLKKDYHPSDFRLSGGSRVVRLATFQRTSF